MDKSLFREKNLKRAEGPEQLDSYLKVTGFSAWFVVAAAALVVAALFLWLFHAEISETVKGAGYCRDGVITCYFPQKEIEEISIGDSLDVSGSPCRITDVNSDLYLAVGLEIELLPIIIYRSRSAMADFSR